jgi:hypothetical protein
MYDTMAPPMKRRKLLDPVQHVSQQSEAATKSSVAPFSHGVEHISTQPTRSLYAHSLPHHVEEVHLEIHKRSVLDTEERLRILRRQGTAAASDIISTNSDADLVIAVTAMVDALGSTTALTTTAVTVDLPGVSSLVSTSSTTAVVSTDSSEPTSSSVTEPSVESAASTTPETSAEPTSSSVSETSAEPTGSTAPESSTEPASSAGPSSSGNASSSDNSSSYGTPSQTSISSSDTTSSSDRLQTYAVSPASENSDDDTQNESQSESSSSEPVEYGTGSSVVLSSTTSSAPATTNASTSQTATIDSSTASNSTTPASTSGNGQSTTSQIVISASASGQSAQIGSASSINSLNLTTSGKLSPMLASVVSQFTDFSLASTSTSGSVILVSDFTANYASSTTETDSQATDSSSSIDLNILFLATQSNGDVQTITKSDAPFTTSLSNGQTTVVPPSSTRASDSRASASSASGSVVTISDGQSTVLSTFFSTPTPSSTQSSSDDPNGVGLAGVAGDGATATSNGITSTSAATETNDDDNVVAPAGTIAGGVVGGAAGLALIALMVLLFLRRYKKRAQLGHLALPANAAGPVTGSSGGPSSGGAGMAERAGLMPFAGAVPALFRHQSRSQHSGSETGERGFQRVAGRKLPSAFSEGMTGPPLPPTSPPPTMPLVDADSHERNLSAHSFYRDSAGFYGGDGSSTSPDPFSDTNLPAAIAGTGAAEQMIMSPGPQRRPTIHKAQSNVQNASVAASGTPSWTPSHTAAFARSDTPASLDGSRNSRFTEEV